MRSIVASGRSGPGLERADEGAPSPRAGREDIEDILEFILDSERAGQAAALVTLAQVSGSSARRPGSHMGVRSDGTWIGSFSGGCVEAAIAAEGRAAIERDEVREVRFGCGSPYIDVRLPCGGGIDLLVTPHPEAEQIDRALRLLKGRRPCSLIMGMEKQRLRAVPAEPDHRTSRLPGGFLSVHIPPLRIVVAGQGAECRALTMLARAWGAGVVLASPDEALLGWAASLGLTERQHLVTAASRVAIPTDPWTAILLLFHDHDWEAGLLAQLAPQPSFYVGAMGSRRTHAERIARLRIEGVAEEALARIRGPVGLLPSSRDPHTIALSALAEIVGDYEALANEPA